MAVLCIIFSLIWFPAFTSTSKPCNNNPSEYGFALLGHVYKSFLADRLVSCYISCNMQPACQSLNYNLADKTCELNNDTKYFRPRHFLEKVTFVYAENPDSGKLWNSSLSCTYYALQWFVPFVLFLVDSGQRKFLEVRTCVTTARHASTKPSF